MSANIIYNHMSTARGRFDRLEGVGFVFIEERICQKKMNV